MSKNRIKPFLSLSIFLFLIVSYLSNNTMESIGFAVSISFGFIHVYNLILWKFNPFEKMPRLKKNYTAEYLSSYDDGKKKYKWHVIVNQSLSELRITEIDQENTKSYSYSAEICKGKHNDWLIYYTYSTYPESLLSEKRGDFTHYGTCILNVNSNKSITGIYFTNRKTKGTVEWSPVQKVDCKLYTLYSLLFNFSSQR